ncbi:MAG: tRNA preQ1(34) S-adenosylmethionine ribosyltransferase-isomerase QueA [Synergistaceae bacterium]|nr:tRNA preQ1(34) S-adenosylmethionine ribosyltransferase-isomerase QueA [Synergistaceae bacterium]
MPDDALWDIASYDYDLPEGLIAQDPSPRRDGSRLMCLSRSEAIGRDISHGIFSDLPNFLMAGDLLVLNDTRVFRARLVGNKLGGGAAVEIFCLAPDGGDPFVRRALVRPGRKLPPGTGVELPCGLVLSIGERMTDGLRLVTLPRGIEPAELFRTLGQIPLPPYIKKSTAPGERYQTVYAKPENDGSVAAPTAGLHFTDELLGRLEASGVGHEFVTLDVGLGTFRSVKTADVREHKMHGERCRVGAAAAKRINEARRSGRVVAVGTTVVRTLESMSDDFGIVNPGEIETDIFIRPGYRFKSVDALLTNFHLPRSTLLMLVSAFAGHEKIMNAYAEAAGGRYRFFSFGDVMLID